MYVLTSNNQPVVFPYSVSQLKADNPQISFPQDLSDETLAAFNVFPVAQTQAPACDPAIEVAEQSGCSFSGQGWEVTWAVRNKTTEEAAAYQLAVQNDIVVGAQKRLDDFARTRNYDGILSACTYATSTVPKFQSEGQYCVTARDATWATLYQILADIQAGTRPMPTGYDDVAGELPVLTWPTA